MLVKFVTLNMWDGGMLFGNLLKFLKEQDADVVILQEVYNGTDVSLMPQYRSMQILHDCLDYRYYDFVADYLDIHRTSGKAQRGNAVLSRFPIARRHATFFNQSYSETYRDIAENAHNCPRHIQHVVLAMPLGNIDVFNIHGVWDLDGDRFGAARQHMSKVIVELVKDKQNVVLAGDTNAKPTNQAIQNIAPYLNSVFEDKLTTTFNMRRKDNHGYATSVVDMMFTSFNVDVLDRQCPNVDVSDHLPLVAELYFK